MGSIKAPGEDGYLALFYKHNWSHVGNLVGCYIQKVRRNVDLIRYINNTLLVLNPKIDKPEFISQFCPISLCNTIY